MSAILIMKNTDVPTQLASFLPILRSIGDVTDDESRFKLQKKLKWSIRLRRKVKAFVKDWGDREQNILDKWIDDLGGLGQNENADSLYFFLLFLVEAKWPMGKDTWNVLDHAEQKIIEFGSERLDNERAMAISFLVEDCPNEPRAIAIFEKACEDPYLRVRAQGLAGLIAAERGDVSKHFVSLKHILEQARQVYGEDSTTFMAIETIIEKVSSNL